MDVTHALRDILFKERGRLSNPKGGGWGWGVGGGGGWGGESLGRARQGHRGTVEIA